MSRRARRVKAGEWDGDRESRKGGMENTSGTKPPGVWEIIILFLHATGKLHACPSLKNPTIESQSAHLLNYWKALVSESTGLTPTTLLHSVHADLSREVRLRHGLARITEPYPIRPALQVHSNGCTQLLLQCENTHEALFRLLEQDHRSALPGRPRW